MKSNNTVLFAVIIYCFAAGCSKNVSSKNDIRIFDNHNPQEWSFLKDLIIEKELWFREPSPTIDGYKFFNADGSIYEINEIKHNTFIYGKRIGKWSIDVNKGEFKIDYSPYIQYLLKCCFLKCGLIAQNSCTIGCTSSNRFPETMYDFFGELKSSKLKEWPLTFQNEGDYTITSDYGDIKFTR